MFNWHLMRVPIRDHYTFLFKTLVGTGAFPSMPWDCLLGTQAGGSIWELTRRAHAWWPPLGAHGKARATGSALP